MSGREFELCSALLRAESETEVESILAARGLWHDDDNNWLTFGANDNNFSTIGNQQSHPEAALVEKLVNSIDAVLTRACLEAGIDPEGPDAPQSIKAAAQRYFNVPAGSLAELTAKELTALATNVGLVATGLKSALNLTIFDRGEGQLPERFPDTFLSLNKSNKLRIPFVQGKFNMGGTGVLQFCGHRNLQVIVSRRHATTNGAGAPWGFTVVRRDDPAGSRRSSVYRYLAPMGAVLSFPHPSGGLGLRLSEEMTEPLTTLDCGSVVKLFDYALAPGAKTNILFDLRNHLAALMPRPALPVRLYERRRRFSGHTLEANLEGLSIRLDRDSRDSFEFEPTTHTFQVMGQHLTAEVYAFKRKPTRTDADKTRSGAEKFRGSEGIIFTVNGQSHGHFEKSFFRRKSVDMSYLSEDILVIVDASSIDGRGREDLFMNSRDRLRTGQFSRLIERELEKIVGGHELLRELRAKRRAELVASKLEDDSALELVLEEIIKRSPSLASLFVSGIRLADPYRIRGGDEDRLAFIGKQFPTFFRLMKNEDKGTAHIGQRFRVQFETDASNDYLTRTNEPGVLRFETGSRAFVPSVNALNGIVTCSFELPAGVRAGETLQWRGSLEDPSRTEPMDFEFVRVVADAVERRSSRSGERKPPTVEGAGNRQLPQGISLPEVHSVRREGWPLHGFDRESALKIVGMDGKYDFFVNLDNVYLAAELRGRAESRAVVEAKFKYGLTLFGLALIKHTGSTNGGEGLSVEEAVLGYSRAFAPFLLPMIDGLSELDDTFEAQSDSDEDVA